MDGGVRSFRRPPPAHPPTPNTRLLRLEAPRQMIGLVLPQNVLQKLKKKKKEILQSQVRASRTHRRSSSLPLWCFILPSAAQHIHTFCSPTFHCASDGSSISDYVRSDSGFQRCATQRGKWQREKEHKLTFPSLREGLKTKEAAQF